MDRNRTAARSRSTTVIETDLQQLAHTRHFAIVDRDVEDVGRQFPLQLGWRAWAIPAVFDDDDVVTN